LHELVKRQIKETQRCHNDVVIRQEERKMLEKVIVRNHEVEESMKMNSERYKPKDQFILNLLQDSKNWR